MITLLPQLKAARPLLSDLMKQLNAPQTRSGDWLGTEVELAQQYGVCRMTVRRALDQLVDQKLIERRRGKGVFVHQPPREKVRHYNIQVVVPDLSSDSCIRAANGIQAKARELGSRVTVQVFNAHGHLAHACDLLRNLPRNAMDGAVLRYVSDPEFLNAVYELQRVNYPVVLVDRPGEMNMPWVGSDCYTGSYQCAEALFEMGHRRVAYIGPLRSPSSRACLSGLRDAMNDKGVVWPLEMICDLSETTTPLGDWTDAIEQSLRKLLACTPRPTTVVFSGDKAAAIAYQLLRKMGLRVPDDLSIVGNGDMDIAQLINPPLSTLRQPFYEAGYEAMRMLLERLEQPDKQLESVQLSTQWVERESVARLV